MDGKKCLYVKKAIIHVLVLYFGINIFSLAIYAGLVSLFGDLSADCDGSYYRIAKYALVVALVVTIAYDAKFGKKKESYQWVKYAALNVCVFSSVNWMAFYCLFKENLCAERVDGQWILGCIYSGVLAAAVVVLNGVILDLLRSYYCEDTEWERLEDSKKK